MRDGHGSKTSFQKKNENILPILLLLKTNIKFEAALRSDPKSMHYKSSVGNKSTRGNAHFYAFYDYKYFPSANHHHG